MTVRVYINPAADTIPDNNGVGQVIHAQHRYLPDFDIELVSYPEMADVIACHIEQGGLPRVDILHCHGLYWQGDSESGTYSRWHTEANSRILASARKAYAITVPSDWVAEPFKRDMRITPDIIGHGIDLKHWPKTATSSGYVLWNKNRQDDVCHSAPAYELARRGIHVVSTFAPRYAPIPATMQITGVVSHQEMASMVRHAEVYLATTKETFGIGTLEALASGVPVLGYRWGGTASLIEHEVSGYLVEPGDIDGLMEGLAWIQEHRDEVRKAARERAKLFSWKKVIAQYAKLYHRVAEEKAKERHGVSAVITCHNYAPYVGKAIESCLKQNHAPEEIIVVDDGSTDESAAIIQAYAEQYPQVQAIIQQNHGVAAARNNGIAQATQPYLICLDADDELHPEYVRVCRNALEDDRGLGVVYTGLGLLQEDGSVSPNPWPPNFDWEAQATPANPPSNCIPCAAMVRRTMWERAGGYNQIYAPGEDTEFFTRGLSVGFTAKRITEEPLFHYRIHSGSASRTKTYKPIDIWHPWMRDKQFPMAAPAKTQPLVRSYSTPAVSIIIPVGPGHVHHLPFALDTILGQTCRHWEVIVVNDGKRGDDPVPWKNIQRTYPFVRIVHTQGGQGPAVARNTGLEYARAPLTLFLDADDYLMANALERMLQAYAENNGTYVYSDFYTLYGNEMKLEQVPDYLQKAWLEKGQHAITALIPTVDVRGLQGFDTTLPGWEDWDFFIRLALSGICGVRIPEPLLVYRQHTGSIREHSIAQKDAIFAIFKERYGDFATGKKELMGCCGGNGSAILAAKRALADAALQAPGIPMEMEIINPSPKTMRMEFIGEQRGSTAYVGRPSGTLYRGGNNPYDKYINADPRDVDYLESLGVWRVVYQQQMAGALA